MGLACAFLVKPSVKWLGYIEHIFGMSLGDCDINCKWMPQPLLVNALRVCWLRSFDDLQSAFLEVIADPVRGKLADDIIPIR